MRRLGHTAHIVAETWFLPFATVVLILVILVILRISVHLQLPCIVFIPLLLETAYEHLFLVVLRPGPDRGWCTPAAAAARASELSRRRRTGWLEPSFTAAEGITPAAHGHVHLSGVVTLDGVIIKPRTFAYLPLGPAYHTKLGSAAARGLQKITN